MIVCHCTGATDRDIRRAATINAPGVPAGLCASPAGQCCGGCADKVREIVASTKSVRASDERGRAARD